MKKVSAVAAGLLVVGLGAAFGQQIWRGGYGGYHPAAFPTKDTFKGTFNFCRLMFTSNRREKRGWDTDYPGADINFSVRLAELTKTRVSTRSGDGDPDHVVVRLTDEALFQCPYLLIEDGGTAAFSDEEARRFSEYLRKGGFVFASDTWGDLARAQFEGQIARVLPPSAYPFVALPLEAAIWRMQYTLTRFPQMPSIQSWRRTGRASERGPADQVEVRGIADERGRLMVAWYHNADIPDGWEREGEEPEYFYRFSPDAYSVGVNVLLYAMSH